MKKIYETILICVLVICVNTITVHAANHTVSYNGAAYVYSDAGELVSVSDAVGAIDLADFATENGIELKSIGARALNKAKNITSVNLPASVQIIGERAFFECTSLTEVTYEEGSELTTIGKSAFALDSMLNTFHQKGDSSTGVFIFPEGLTAIGIRALQSTIPTEITLPCGVTQLADGTFMYCKNLTKINFDNDIISIGDGAFAYSGIEEITIPESCLRLGANAFQTDNKDATLSVTILNNTIIIGENAFPSTTIIYANSDSTAAQYAGNNGIICQPIADNSGDGGEDGGNVNDGNEQSSSNEEGNKTGAEEKDNVDSSGDANGKNDVNTVNQDADNPGENKTSDGGSKVNTNETNSDDNSDGTETSGSVKTEENGAGSDGKSTAVNIEKGKQYTVNGLVYKTVSDSAVAFVMPKKKSITKLRVPDKVKIDGITYQVTDVSAKACYKLAKLKTVTIGNNVSVVGKQAFMGCRKLKSVTFGKGLTKLGEKCFCNDKSLKKVVIKSKKLKKVGKNCMKGTPSKRYMIPKGYAKKYKKLFVG